MVHALSIQDRQGMPGDGVRVLTASKLCSKLVSKLKSYGHVETVAIKIITYYFKYWFITRHHTAVSWV
jgi:hypothetical protein